MNSKIADFLIKAAIFGMLVAGYRWIQHANANKSAYADKKIQERHLNHQKYESLRKESPYKLNQNSVVWPNGDNRSKKAVGPIRMD